MKKILNSILHRFKEDSLGRRQDLTMRKVEYKGLKEIKKGLVVWTAGDDLGNWSQCLAERFGGVKFDRLCFVPEGKEMAGMDSVVTFRNEDLGFGGKIQNEALHQLLKQNYDILIDLTVVSNTFVHYVLGNVQAGCIVGMKKEDGVADIVVDGVGETTEFINKLADLLAKINTY